MKALSLALVLAACGSDDAMTPSAPTAAELLAITAECGTTIGGPYATDTEGTPSVSICAAHDVVFWTADFDVDCDGKRSDVCNETTDDAYQPQTSTTDANDEPLDASQLPYVVVPLPSARFDSTEHGIELGTVVAVLYDDRVVYGVFADEGPEDIIGEASYAMAVALGIDPDPNTGGVDGPVRYIAFPGVTVDPIEDHDVATALGEDAAADLVQ
jgi:hypothetical protein